MEQQVLSLNPRVPPPRRLLVAQVNLASTTIHRFSKSCGILLQPLFSNHAQKKVNTAIAMESEAIASTTCPHPLGKLNVS
eukprot:5122754-Amphidinium_carterae.1